MCYGGPGLYSVYPNQPTAGTNGQTVNLYGCLPSNGSGYGTLTLNTPSGVTQVGGLTVSPIGQGGAMIQGAVNIAYNAQLGTPTSPPLIGLNQQLNGCNENSNNIPYYITPTCPTSITIANSATENLTSIFDNGRHLTGIGLWTQMQLNPTNGLWSTALSPIYEEVSPVPNSDTCISPRGPINLCGYQQQAFHINTLYTRIDGTQEPATENAFNDEHAAVDFNSPESLLTSINMNSCQAACTQTYFCGAIPLTMYSLNYNLTLGTIDTVPVTNVMVTKSQIGNGRGANTARAEKR